MNSSPHNVAPQRVLVTGNAGHIGRVVAAALAERGHDVRGFDRRDADNVAQHITGDLADPDACGRAVDHIDTVVHLAAMPKANATWEQLLKPNVIGLYHMFDQARQAGVRRMVLASSVNACNMHKRSREQRPIHVEDGPAPGNLYGVTKVWAEEMGRHFAILHGLQTLAVRLGWFPRNTREKQRLDERRGWNTFLSHDDTRRFFVHAVEATGDWQFEIVFAISRPHTVNDYDPEPARRLLRYEPRDVFPDGCQYDE